MATDGTHATAPLGLLQEAMNKRHGSLDLLTLCRQVAASGRAASAEAKQSEADERKARRADAKAAKEAAKAARDTTHTMVRRSHLQEIMEKIRPSNDDRQLLIDHLGVSKCFSCHEVKEVSEFYRRKARRVGIESICSECIYAKFNKHPKRNYLRLMYNHCKTRANQKSFEFDLVQQDLHDLFDRQEGLCALSSQPMTFIYKRGKREFVRHPTNASLDRIDPRRGYTKDNIQMTTNLCNHSKMDLLEDAFFRMCRQVVATADALGK